MDKFTAETIEEKYRDLGYKRGWNFLACREERLQDAHTAIVGLNPGGPADYDEYVGVWSCENNSLCEDPSRLRDQVREWHRILSVEWDETLCAQFIPFRSPDLTRLGNRAEAFDFARDLWDWVLRVSPASLFVVMGNEATWQLVDLMKAKLVVCHLPTNWGKTTIDVWESADGRRIIKMPHPSTYKLFGRGEASADAEASLRCAAGVDS